MITFLGTELDTASMTAHLPIEKLHRYQNTILSVTSQNKVTPRLLKSIIGMLQFATAVVTPGRLFLRRLYDLTMQVTKPHHFIRLTKEVKEHLCMWFSFLQSYNGKTIINRQLVTMTSTAHLYSDASKKCIWIYIWRTLDTRAIASK